MIGAADADIEPVNPSVLLAIRSFRQPPWRTAVQAGLFLSVAAIGVLIAVGQPPTPEIGWPIALVGAAVGVLVPVATVFGGRRRVELSDEGFVVCGLLTTERHRWSEVSDFILAGLLPGRSLRQTYVVYDAIGDSGPRTWLNRFLSGRSRSLPIGIEPEGLPGNAVTVALTMNAWRERALDPARSDDA